MTRRGYPQQAEGRTVGGFVLGVCALLCILLLVWLVVRSATL